MHQPSDTAIDELQGDVRQSIWTAYWNSGALHSLPGSFQHNYTGGIHDFWLRTFLPLDNTHHVLDIGTGNGALPALLCKLKQTSMPAVDAIDIATITPEWLGAEPQHCQERVRFHSETSIEQLPFAAASFDLIVSQYGFEYTQRERAIGEMARTLAPHGTVALVMHHADSHLIRVAKEELSLTKWLLSGNHRLLNTAASIFPYIHMAANGQHLQLASDPAATSCRHAFNTAMRELAEYAGTSPFPDVLLETRQTIAGLIDGLSRHGLSIEQAHSLLDAFSAQLQAAAFRHSELCRYALNQEDMQALSELMNARNLLPLKIDTLHHDSHLVGWTATFKHQD